MRKRIGIKRESGEIVAENVAIANTFFTRFIGLMFRRQLEENDGLLLMKTKQIHTFWMMIPIDVIYLKETEKNIYEIIDFSDEMEPWHISKYRIMARDTLELKSGTIHKKNLEIGERLVISTNIN